MKQKVSPGLQYIQDCAFISKGIQKDPRVLHVRGDWIESHYDFFKWPRENITEDHSKALHGTILGMFLTKFHLRDMYKR
jgi:hypothetical protein